MGLLSFFKKLFKLPDVHEEWMNKEPDEFVCMDCDKSFGTRHGLLIHNGRKHK